MRRISKSWRWPLAGTVLAAVGALFVPVGGTLWVHLLVALCALTVLVRLAHREVPFPLALAQLRLGGDDPVVLRARVLSAAAAWMEQGRLELAAERLKSVLPDLTRVLGASHPDTLSARLLSLQVRGETGDLPDRLAAIRELVADITPVLGPGHPDTLAARHFLAEWLNEDGRTDEAEAAYEDVVATGTEHLGADHNLVLIARSRLTILRHSRGGPDSGTAVDDMTTLVADMERTLGPAHPTAASTRRLLTQWQNTGAGSGA
ncbi:tetratricopeptide repeat protein [Streptomyces sp. AK08-02]|uniref:tetratricopeptide repeat protein n=1 Tax=Streptomyces sp. AK08-02 TaxID=3028654 RepID=UPI0029AF7D37|nr:tetratricopeptide repeat protein [Streptomyces sp. AK08-02]MDX3751020.1 tetratricopeptide repeat protein [Streptomyces sp. AK08-02]